MEIQLEYVFLGVRIWDAKNVGDHYTIGSSRSLLAALRLAALPLPTTLAAHLLRARCGLTVDNTDDDSESMPSSILNLKFKVRTTRPAYSQACACCCTRLILPNAQGNKSFVAFSNLGDSDSLTKTWKVCNPLSIPYRRVSDAGSPQR